LAIIFNKVARATILLFGYVRNHLQDFPVGGGEYEQKRSMPVSTGGERCFGEMGGIRSGGDARSGPKASQMFTYSALVGCGRLTTTPISI
jgi:hypothetical protein